MDQVRVAAIAFSGSAWGTIGVALDWVDVLRLDKIGAVAILSILAICSAYAIIRLFTMLVKMQTDTIDKLTDENKRLRMELDVYRSVNRAEKENKE